MNPLIIKILAVGLTISQVFTKDPDQIRLQFDPQADRAEVTAILRQGCVFAAKEFGAEDLDIGSALDLAKMAITRFKDKSGGGASDGASSRGIGQNLMAQIDLDLLEQSYKVFCRDEDLEKSGMKIEEAIAFYNNAMKDLPDPTKIKGLKLPEASTILDRDGNRFTEVYAENGRRRFVPIAQLPPHVKQAFISAEDQRFLQHKGIDMRGILRAFASGMSGKGRPQGGSTITQQVVKNLLVGDDVTFERKIREMVLAARVEKILSKDEILELYLNYVYLGRASWGIDMASRSYFGKPATQLTLSEAAMLAGLAKGPNYYRPDKFPDRAKDRLGYVLGRMAEDKFAKPEQVAEATKQQLQYINFETPRTRSAFYYIDEINRDAKRKAHIPSLTGGAYLVRSTIHPQLQKTAEEALQEGLMAYEAAAGRSTFKGPVGNIEDRINKFSSDWQTQLGNARSQLYDVRLPLAVVLGRKFQNEKGKIYTTKDTRVGLADGRVASLYASASALNKLRTYDLVHVRLKENGKSLTASLMNAPTVQGGVVIMEAKTGRVLAMQGGFSYAASQFNRVTQGARQPGSTLKPFIYLSALNMGYQPNTLVPDTAFSLPPIIGGRGAKYWTPKNYDGGSHGLVTVRRAVERSLNLPTARMMASMVCNPVGRGRCERDPTSGLDYIRMLTNELGIYRNPLRVYPFVLGAQPARLIDMATAYATIANISTTPPKSCPKCLKPVPHFVDTIEQNGKLIYQRQRLGLLEVPSMDRVAIYQIRRILEGTVARGTAVAIKDLAGYVAGKTGTSNNENDAWFVGFTNDLVVAVWVGYDSRDVRASLGGRFTGGKVALPIAERIFRKSFEIYRPMEPLSPMPADLKGIAVEYPIDVNSGEINGGDFLEVFRVGRNQSILNTRSNILRGAELERYMIDPARDLVDLAQIVAEPAGEEENPSQMAMLTGDEEREADPGESYAEVEPAYKPGADDVEDLWQERGRNVDPQFVNFYQSSQPQGQPETIQPE